MVSGKKPFNLNLTKDKDLRWLQFPNSAGIELAILLEDPPIHSVVREEQFPRDGGIILSKFVLRKYKPSSFCSNPNSPGTEPDKILIEPKSSIWRALSCPNSGGILPLNLLPKRPNAHNEERLPREGESIPSRPDKGRYMETTLLLCFMQRIAFHEHMLAELWVV